MREREDANRTREAGNRDEIEGVVANTLKLHRKGAVGFIDWLDLFDVELEIFKRFVIEPELDCILAFGITASDLNVFNVK